MTSNIARPAVSVVVYRAQRAEMQAQAADAALRAAQLHAYRANVAQLVAARHLSHRPTGRRPVYSSAPGSARRLLATALLHRRTSTEAARIGYCSAWLTPRRPARPAICGIAFV